MVEHRSAEFLNSPALEARQMQVIAFGARLVVMLFPFQVHQVELVDQPQLLQQFDGAVYRGAVDSRRAFASQLQQGSGIQVSAGFLNNLPQPGAAPSAARFSPAIRPISRGVPSAAADS